MTKINLSISFLIPHWNLPEFIELLSHLSLLGPLETFHTWVGAISNGWLSNRNCVTEQQTKDERMI